MSELADLCARHCPKDGEFSTPLEGVTLFRRSHPSEELCGVQRPAMGVVAQGTKSVSFGPENVVYGPDQYLLVSVDMPLVHCSKTSASRLAERASSLGSASISLKGPARRWSHCAS